MATTRPFGFPSFPAFPGGGADPFRELRRLQDEMGRLVQAFAPTGGLMTAAGFPAVNVYAGRDGIAVVAELPGVEPGDLEVHAHRDTLTIRGTRRPPAEREDAYHRRERRDRKSTRLNSSHANISHAVFCLKKKKVLALAATHPPPARTVTADL